MGQSIIINFDSDDLTTARARSVTDLRKQDFAQFVSGDALVLDLFLTGTSGLLNIQDYSEVRVGIGDLDARPTSGTYSIDTTNTLNYNHSASELETIIDSVVSPATVTELANFVFKIQFEGVGAQTIPAIDSRLLTPSSTVSVTKLVTGDATTKETWLWRIYQNPAAFTKTFTNISGNGVRGTLSLATSGIYDLLGSNPSVKTYFEVELTDSDGTVQTVLQARVTLNGEVIGHNFTGSIPVSPSIPPSATAFLESFPDPTIEGSLSVVATSENLGRVIVDDQILVSTLDGTVETFTLVLPSRNLPLGQTARATYLDYIDKKRYPISFYVQSGSTTLSNVSTISGFGSNLNLTDFYFGGKVSTVAASAFDGCTNLVNLSLNNDLRTIQTSAFKDCTGLPIPDEFPDGLITLQAQAFRGALNVTQNETLLLPRNVLTIGDSAFQEAFFYGLRLGENTRTLGSNAFRSAPLFNSFERGGNTRLQSIGNSCFQDVSVATFDFSETDLKTIGTGGFRDNTALTTVTLPDNAGFTIGPFAFHGCTNLNNFTIPSSVTRIESNTFRSCSSLDSITIPAGVTLIDDGSFRDCTSLGTINCLAGIAPSLGTIGNAFLNVGTTSINVPIGATGYESVFGGLNVNYVL